jgi:hypothetical protein
MSRTGATGLVVAAAAAIALAAVGVARGTWSVGGSDSSCYALTALAIAGGALQPSSALAVDAPWPDASRTFAPGGFIPSPVHRGAASPICAPGMSLVMAPLALLFGRDAIFWFVPLSAAVLVLSAFNIGHHLAGAMAGAVAAVLTAASPIVLFQVVQPMNDVPTAALWLSALAFAIRRRPMLAGIIVGVAILVRPNLAPLAFVVASIPFVLRDRRASQSGARFVAGSIPGVAVMLFMNNALYGGVLATGYGDAATLFSVSHIDDNLANFARALFATHNVVPAIGLAAPVLLGGEARRLSVVLIVVALIVVAIYLLYQPFPEWWYLRFLMPAIVVMLILTSVVGVDVASRVRARGLVPIAAVVVAILGVRMAADRDAFALQRLEGRYRQTADVVVERLPSNAVLITVWQSGSMRFHADRDALLWDSLDPEWLDRAVAWLLARGLRPYLLFERREEGEFRARFRGRSEFGALDWPPRIDINRQVRIYDPGDRVLYLSGQDYATDNIRPR